MRQVWITKAGPPEVLAVREGPDPEASEGEIRLRVRAAGVNFADLMARIGLYPDAPKIPCVVGYEVAGVVDQVGPGVTGFREGDAVFGVPHFGGYTDVITLPAGQAFPIPEGMSFNEAAATPVAYLTAHHMMVFTGHLREGSHVLIHSAAGAVGLAAIELAKTRKAVIYGTASPSKHAFLRDWGCHHPIDSSTNYVQAVRDIVGSRGLDLVLDPIGGRSWADGFELLGPCGRLVTYGFATAAGRTRNLFKAASAFLKVPKFSPMALMDQNKTVSGTNMAHLFGRLDLLRPQVEALIALYKDGHIHPWVDKAFSFDEAAAAHQYLHSRQAIGKVILVP